LGIPFAAGNGELLDEETALRNWSGELAVSVITVSSSTLNLVVLPSTDSKFKSLRIFEEGLFESFRPLPLIREVALRVLLP